MDLLRQTLGGRKPTFWDLCGAMVYNKWLAPIRPIAEYPWLEHTAYWIAKTVRAYRRSCL